MYRVMAVDYTTKFVEAEPLKEKTGETTAKFLYKLLCQNGSCDIHFRYKDWELVASVSEEFYCLT